MAVLLFNVWLVDFEFHQEPGGLPHPLCMVSRNFRTGDVIKLWLDGDIQPCCPFPADHNVLLVAFYASAEVGCFLALGWPVPLYILDLYAEFRWLTCGLNTIAGHTLLGALTRFGLAGGLTPGRWT